MPIIDILKRKNNKDIEMHNDGISIRNIKEQNKYVKSPEYKRILKDLEELKERREKRHIREKKRMNNYNKNRYKLERKIYDLTTIETTNYFQIKVDRIHKITQDGKIIEFNK